MSNTVKLLIELPEKTVAHIRSDYGHGYKTIGYDDKDIIVDAIYNARRFDSLIQFDDLKVSKLMDILFKVDPDAYIFVEDDEYHTVSDSTFVDIAPSGNVFIHYNNWYMQMLEARGYLKRPTSVQEDDNGEQRNLNNPVPSINESAKA